MMLSRIPALRKIGMPLLRRFGDRDATIRHHWTGAKLRLNMFRHRGYWFFGRKREQSSVERARSLIAPGDTVLELGGHIGYLTLIFADAVGEKGRVVVFEPAEVNLPYIRANVAPIAQATLEEKAVADFEGRTSFHSEDLSGQNSSLVADYSVGQEIATNAHVEVNMRVQEVEVTTIDAYCTAHDLKPDFIKIDIEGAELAALKGAKNTLAAHLPKLMVEVTEDSEAVAKLLGDLGYRLITPEGEAIALDDAGRFFNIFALPPEAAA